MSRSKSDKVAITVLGVLLTEGVHFVHNSVWLGFKGQKTSTEKNWFSTKTPFILVFQSLSSKATVTRETSGLFSPDWNKTVNSVMEDTHVNPC